MLGTPVVLSGVATGFDKVKLEAWSAAGWTAVKAVRPDAAGAFTVEVTPDSPTRYRLATGDVGGPGVVVEVRTPAVTHAVIRRAHPLRTYLVGAARAIRRTRDQDTSLLPARRRPRAGLVVRLRQHGAGRRAAVVPDAGRRVVVLARSAQAGAGQGGGDRLRHRRDPPRVRAAASPPASRTSAARGSTDTCGHGTFVAGEIAANPSNGLGIAGLAFNARLLVAKVDAGRLQRLDRGRDRRASAGPSTTAPA